MKKLKINLVLRKNLDLREYQLPVATSPLRCETTRMEQNRFLIQNHWKSKTRTTKGELVEIENGDTYKDWKNSKRQMIR